MGTSFLQQLQKLAVPQTDLFLNEKKKVSLLFDPKEAATFDRDTFFELGIHGLEELKKINPIFGEFEETLFDVTSKNLQRAVQTKDVNEKLDKEILKFMCHLSPYFLLNASHKTLEWLIQRFQIHRYNVDHLMMLILPYHSTNMFVRVVQLLKIKDPNNRWHWLHPLQNAGVPLAKKTLLNHCASSNWFLSFVCQMPAVHLQKCGDYSKALHTLCTFCCTTIVGMIMHTKEMSENQVTHVVKLLIENIWSPFIEFSCMCIIIAANLVRTTKLNSDVLMVLVNKLSRYPHTSLYTESCIVLALIYQNQQETISEVSKKALIKLSQSSLFLPSLQKIIDGGGYVVHLLVALTKTSMKNILLNIQTQMLEKFMESLVSCIRFDDSAAEKVILVVVQTYVNERNAESTGSLEVDENIEEADQAVVLWYSHFIRNLERQYPSAFDVIIKRAMETTQEANKRKNLLELLGFVPRMHFQKSQTDMFEKFHHPNVSIRVEGVEYLIRTLDKLKEEDKDFVQDIMRNRLQEHNIEVVQAVLKCPASSLASLVGEEFFVMQIIKISTKYWYKDTISLPIRKLVVSYLCSDVSFRTNPTAVWIAVLPYLLPKDGNAVNLAKIALKSEFGSKHKFMLAVKTAISNLDSPGDPNLFCSAVLEVLSDDQFIPSVSDLINIRNQIPVFNSEVIYKFIFSILLTTASHNEDVEVKWEVMDEIMKYYTSPEVTYKVKGVSLLKTGEMTKCINVVQSKNLPIYGLLHFLFSLTSEVHLPGTISGKHWWHISSENIRKNHMLFFIRIFEILIEGCMQDNSPRPVRTMYVRCLKNFFENTFPNIRDQLRFLSNLWVINALGESLRGIMSYELQLRALLLGRSLLLKSDQFFRDEWIEHKTIVPSLLISLSCPLSPVRVATLELLTVLKDSMGTKEFNGYRLLVSRLLDYKEELKIDYEQISVVLYKLLSPDPAVQHHIPGFQRKTLATVMNVLFDCVIDDTPWHIRAAILKILTHVNSKKIMKKLSALGCKILSNAKSNGNQLDVTQSVVLCNILTRIDQSTFCTDANDVWELFEKALLDSKSVLRVEKKVTCPSVIALNQITRDFFQAIPDRQETILRILVSIATEADNPEVVSIVGHVVKKIVLNCKHIVVGLERMRDCKVDYGPSMTGRKRNSSIKKSVSPPNEVLKMLAWREGTSLLELIQNKKKLNNVHLLLPSLFNLLKRCLDFEEQAPVEYVKQLILSLILHVCNKLSMEQNAPAEEVSEKTINVELVVQCIRASQNPQTHHHALLVLSQLAGMLPEQVLHNIMAIFAFMGSTILRQEDAYSFQIISKVVDSVIPILVKANDAGVDPDNLFDPVAGVMRVFVDALLDIPVHRQIPLFHKLVDTVGCEKFLWLLLALVIECQVKHRTGPEQYKDGILPKRLEFIVQLCLKIHPSIVIENSISLMQYLKTLPIEKDQKVSESMNVNGGCKLTKLFDVANSTRSEFHHFKYAIIIFLSGLIGNSDFINQVAVLSTHEVKKMEPLYTRLIECVLQHIQVSVQACDNSAGKPTAKFWKCMLGQSYELLDKVNALLLSDMFLSVILALIENPIHALSRKAMELMNGRLQNEEFYSTCKRDDVLSLLNPLLKIINSISKDSSTEEQLNQQTALASVKLLARLLAAEHTDVFGKILNSLTQIMKVKKVTGNVCASTLLCGAELCSSLKVHSLGYWSEFMSILLRTLNKEKENANPDVVLLAILTAVYKIVESLANFLSPHLDVLLKDIAELSSRLLHVQQTQKIVPIVAKLDLIRQKLASDIPIRILVPVSKEVYFDLLEEQKFGAIGPLMSILEKSFAEVSSSDYNHLRSELSSFFLAALQFRSDCATATFDPEIVNTVEGNVVKALVALVLKLSESSFRPLYYSLFHWATSLDDRKERLITFYRVSHNIAECLKGLFVLFAGYFVQNTTTILSEINLSKSKTLLFGDDKIAEENSLLLLDYVLKTLYSVFLYDSAQFLNKERFDILMQPLVDQLENTLGGLKAYEERTKNILSPCLVQFTVVAADDTMWKQINYQILLRTRHSVPVVRLMALETICGIARKLGDDFLPQLPETIPFLAELMEDEEEMVEAACVRVVQEMEEILGEPLKKYF